MNRNLKRKRRSSGSDQEDNDYDCSHNGKKSRNETSSEVDFKFPSESCVAQEDFSSQLFPSDIAEQEITSSECECDTCTQNNSEKSDISSQHCRQSSEVKPEFEHSQSELHEYEKIHNLSPSLSINNGYSSCDERANDSELAESIADSDLENEDEMHEIICSHEDEYDDLDDCEDTLKPEDDDDDNNEQSACKLSSKVLTFMGQLTPGSSVGKLQSEALRCSTWTSFRNLSVHGELTSETVCPVPKLSWASREKFWEVMCQKDELSLKSRNPDLFEYQQDLKPRMRIILLDWISEVATVFKLHRETYYLSIDYIDRYLSCVPNIPRQQLQLIGITCLVLASKMEEIYPPKIDQFASVTDGACTEEEIFSMEVTVLRHLNWLLSPITINSWLEMMLQFIYQKIEKKNNLFTPQFSSTLFKKLCHLLDLVTLDITSLRFSYCVLAATAIYILVDPDLAISISGLKKEVLEPCVQWMSVYWKVLCETNSSEMANVNDLLTDKSEVYFSNQHPELQTHTISIQLYELVQAEFELIETQKNSKGKNSQILTPPPSSSKSSSTFTNNASDIPCSL